MPLEKHIRGEEETDIILEYLPKYNQLSIELDSGDESMNAYLFANKVIELRDHLNFLIEKHSLLNK